MALTFESFDFELSPDENTTRRRKNNPSPERAKTKKPSKYLFRKAGFAEEMNPKKRNTMEDCHSIIQAFMDDENMSFFAVYDGHGGRAVAEFVESELPINLAVEIEHEKDKTETGGPPTDIPGCLTRAFLMTDLQSSKEAGHEAAGATAVTCLLCGEGDERVLYTANVGDSRAVLYFNGQTKRLSCDHKSDDEQEAQRIKAGGGFLLRDRVLGILAVTRSFGDHCIKACDGVWDVFEDEEATSFVQQRLKGNLTVEKIAEELVEESIHRGSADNVTALIIDL